MARLINNTPLMLRRFRKNIPDALEAIKDDGIVSVHYMMLHGYSEVHRHWVTGGRGTEIYDTGLLYKDVQGLVDIEKKIVRLGNTLYYADYVHDGTKKVHARPYLVDGIETVNSFGKEVAQALSKGIVGVYDG